VAVAQVGVPPLFGEVSGLRSLLQGALELVPEDSIDAGRLQVLSAMALYLENADYATAQTLLESGLDIARREGDTALELQGLGLGSVIEVFEMHHEKTMQRSTQALELSKEAGDLWGQAVAAAMAAWGAQMSVDLARSQEFSAVSVAAAEQVHDRYALARGYFAGLYHALLVGNWSQAREFGEQGLRYAPQDARLLAFTGIAHLQSGELQLGQGYVERLIAGLRALGNRGPSVYGAALSLLLAVDSHVSGSAVHHALGREVAEQMLSWPLPPLYQHLARVNLAVQAADAGDAAAAAGQYVRLLSFPQSTNPMLSERVLGLTAATMGDRRAAVAHFENALTYSSAQRLRPEHAWACCDFAGLLQGRQEAADEARARSLLDEGLIIARELGMRPLIERIIARRELLRA